LGSNLVGPVASILSTNIAETSVTIRNTFNMFLPFYFYLYAKDSQNEKGLRKKSLWQLAGKFLEAKRGKIANTLKHGNA